MGDILAGKAEGRKNPDEIIIFSAGGLPVEDVSWGFSICEEARSKGLGQKLSLWDKVSQV